MKTDRLLSIIIYLLNRDLVSAKELAEKFEVSVRTIQRDMEAINLAGIPVMTIQGPSGGYGILESFKLDKQYVSTEDLFFIITALHGIGASLPEGRIESTIEKMKTLLPRQDDRFLTEREEKLSIDFSAFGGSESQRELFRLIERAVEEERLISFTYSSNKLEQTERTVEPMTLAFKWRSWYLFGYCRLRNDYRIFRLGRIRNCELLDKRFSRREKSFQEFSEESGEWQSERWVDLRLRFAPLMRPVIEEHYPSETASMQSDGSIIVDLRMPEDGWVYGMILSYGKFVEVLSPERIRALIRDAGKEISELYE